MQIIFGPSGLIFLGAFLAAVGATWAAIEQTKFESKLNQITTDTNMSITGGDSFAYIFPQNLGYGKEFNFVVWHEGKYDLHDLDIELSAKILDSFPHGVSLLKDNSSDYLSLKIKENRLAHHTVSSYSGNIALQSGRKYAYGIDFSAKNGNWGQRLHIQEFNGKWEYATFVDGGPWDKRANKILLWKKSDGFDVSVLKKYPKETAISIRE